MIWAYPIWETSAGFSRIFFHWISAKFRKVYEKNVKSCVENQNESEQVGQVDDFESQMTCKHFNALLLAR